MKAALSIPLALYLLTLFEPTTHAADPFLEGVRATDPRPPAEQRAMFKLPPGFEIQLVASEPDINKPMNLAFDAAGRLWVTTSIEYPWAAPTNRIGRDRLMIFEDFAPDGRARKVTEFAGGLNVPIGIYPFRSRSGSTTTWKAIVWSIPHIWLFEDTDGDGKADKREPLYGPFDHTRDTHGNQASFRRGFDGWLYATHGFNNDSHVTGRDGNRVDLNSGNTYRMRLDGSRLEHHTWGQVNPYGLAWDERGNLYSSDCHSAPIYQLLAGGYYPSFGKPHDGLGFAPVMMEHAHGSTAIDGAFYYSDNLWPAEYQDNFFIGNVMTSRLNRDRIQFVGSTPKAEELPDFLTTTDPWFRPVDNILGPDGALYIADFYNRIIGHYEVPLTHPGRDRERGRIWRVIYNGGNPNSELRTPRLPDDLAGLIQELGSPNLTRRLLASSEIQDRFGEQAVPALQNSLRARRAASARTGNANAATHLQLHTLWLLQRLGQLRDTSLADAANRENSLVRVHAMRIIAERGHQAAAMRKDAKHGSPINSSLHKLAVSALGDSDALVRRCAAEALGAWPAFENLRPLLDSLSKANRADTHLVYVLRKALRDQLIEAGVFERVLSSTWPAADSRALADVALGVKSTGAGSFLLQHLERFDETGETLANCVRHAARFVPPERVDRMAELARRKFAGDPDLQLTLFKSMREGAAQRGAPLTAGVRAWGSELAENLLRSADAARSGWFNTPLDGMANPANPWFRQKRRSADGDSESMFLSSLPPGGEQLTGILRSDAFAVPAKLSFFLAGHDGYPDKPAQKRNVARLRAAGTGEVLAEAWPPRNDIAQVVEWNLAAHAGKRGYFELTDGDDGNAYAWLAAGRFSPEVVSLPAINPSRIAQRQQAAAELALELSLTALRPQLASLLKNDRGDLAVHGAAARTLAALAGRDSLGALAMLAGEAAAPREVRANIRRAIADGADSAPLLADTMKSSSHRLQLAMARQLTGTPAGAATLLALAEAGQAPPRLLLNPAIKDRLQAALPADQRSRVEHLTRNLEPVSEEMEKLVAARRRAYLAARPNVTEGSRVFTESCSACHRYKNSGGLVGPQLDGIGNRGLDRLLEDILDPNRNVDHAFRSHTLVLKNGDVMSGLPRREEGDLLIVADSTGKEVPIRKSDIQSRRESEISLMPGNVGDILPIEGLNNLLGYLLER